MIEAVGDVGPGAWPKARRAERAGASESIATATLPPGSRQRVVRRRTAYLESTSADHGISLPNICWCFCTSRFHEPTRRSLSVLGFDAPNNGSLRPLLSTLRRELVALWDFPSANRGKASNGKNHERSNRHTRLTNKMLSAP